MSCQYCHRSEHDSQNWTRLVEKNKREGETHKKIEDEPGKKIEPAGINQCHWDSSGQWEEVNTTRDNFMPEYIFDMKNKGAYEFGDESRVKGSKARMAKNVYLYNSQYDEMPAFQQKGLFYYKVTYIFCHMYAHGDDPGDAGEWSVRHNCVQHEPQEGDLNVVHKGWKNYPSMQDMDEDGEIFDPKDTEIFSGNCWSGGAISFISQSYEDDNGALQEPESGFLMWFGEMLQGLGSFIGMIIPPVGFACTIAFTALSATMQFTGGTDTCNAYQMSLTPAACESWKQSQDHGQATWFTRSSSENRKTELIVETRDDGDTRNHKGVYGNHWDSSISTGGNTVTDLAIRVGDRCDSKGRVIGDEEFVEMVNRVNSQAGYTKSIFSLPVTEKVSRPFVSLTREEMKKMYFTEP